MKKRNIFSNRISIDDFLSALPENSAAEFSSSFKVFIGDKRTREIQQENRILRLWFYQFERERCLVDAQDLMKNILKTNDFPQG